jgi:peptide-methionine (S)-S-oxide reductase
MEAIMWRSRGRVQRFASLAGVLAVAALVAASPWIGATNAEEGRALPAPLADVTATAAKTEVAVLAGGCFWGVQGVFQHVDGVLQAVSGYAGGAAETADYQSVGSGDTGHAESVRVTFDPAKISYGKILQIYFSVAHDPTQLNYQGPDRGPQYRSTIFPASDEQARVAAAYIAQLDTAKVFSDPIVTTLERGKAFYPAEDYHQDYLTLNPTSPYILVNDLPKVENLKRLFPELYRADPVLVTATN